MILVQGSKPKTSQADASLQEKIFLLGFLIEIKAVIS